jgi:PKD repeat protein
MRVFATVVLAVLATAQATDGAIRYVWPASPHEGPGTAWSNAFHTIQPAIDASSDGDIVVVTNGVYRVSATIEITNGITVHSVNGPRTTTVDAQGNCRVFWIASANASIEGLTITGGTGRLGGGVLSAGLIGSCVIVGNAAHQGGGVRLMEGAVMRNCLAVSNTAERGGGVLAGDAAVIDSSTICHNNAPDSGGGLYLTGSASLIRNTIVCYNTSRYEGANVYDQGSTNRHVHCCTHPLEAGAGNISTAPDFADITRGNFRPGVASPCVDSGTNISWTGTGEDLGGQPRISGEAVDMGAYELNTNRLNCGFTGTPRAGLAPLDTVFASSVTGGEADELCYLWDFENNGTFDLTGVGLRTVTNTYTTPGEQSVSLTVSNTAGETAYVLRPEYIAVARSVYLSATPNRGLAPLVVTLTSMVMWTNTAHLHYSWDFDGDGNPDIEGPALAVVTNVFADIGTYSAALTVSNSEGLVSSAIATIDALPMVFVSPMGSHTFPYATWETAATNITAALTACADGSQITVTNGVYALYEPIVVDHAIAIQSVNGPGTTTISGRDAVQCARLNHPESLMHGFTVAHGYSSLHGGGVLCRGTLSGCVVTGSVSVYDGGGVANFGGEVLNCVISENQSLDDAGGVYCYEGGLVRNCLIVNNACADKGGGVYGKFGGNVQNCTVVGNSGGTGGGLCWYGTGTVFNSVFAYNTTSNHLSNWTNLTPGDATFSHCCTLPGMEGAGHITANPVLADTNGNDYRLRPGSVCVDAGTNQAWMATAVDLAGSPRIHFARVDLGAFESTGTGGPALACDFHAYTLEGYTPLEVMFQGWAYGTNATDVYYAWDFDCDGTTDVAGFGLDYVTNVYSATGTFSVYLSVSNALGNTAQRVATQLVHVTRQTTYVSLSGTHIPPYSNWETAATNIQSAIHAAPPGTLVRVAGGTYKPAATLSLTSALVLRANGVPPTVIDGRDSIRLILVNHPEAVLDGFTIRKGRSPNGESGGGIHLGNGILRNCLVISNTAVNAYGGGVHVTAGRIENCTITRNESVSRFGFGSGFLSDGEITVVNSIVYGNIPNTANWAVDRWGSDEISMSHTCTMPARTGTGNITAPPEFVDPEGDFRLLVTSPCIDGGTNLAGVTDDILGVPRPLDGNTNSIAAHDMGAYEFAAHGADTDGDGMSDGWEVTHHLDPTRGAAGDGSHGDPDRDGCPNIGEFVADTDPNDPGSVLAMRQISHTTNGVAVGWAGGTGAWQFLEFTPSLGTGAPSWRTVFTGSPPTALSNEVVRPAGSGEPAFYRVRAQR